MKHAAGPLDFGALTLDRIERRRSESELALSLGEVGRILALNELRMAAEAQDDRIELFAFVAEDALGDRVQRLDKLLGRRFTMLGAALTAVTTLIIVPFAFGLVSQPSPLASIAPLTAVLLWIVYLALIERPYAREHSAARMKEVKETQALATAICGFSRTRIYLVIEGRPARTAVSVELAHGLMIAGDSLAVRDGAGRPQISIARPAFVDAELDQVDAPIAMRWLSRLLIEGQPRH